MDTMESKERVNETSFDKKICLTIPEACAYSGLGRTTIELLLDDPDCKFLLKVGTRRYIKRKVFEEFLNDAATKELKTK